MTRVTATCASCLLVFFHLHSYLLCFEDDWRSVLAMSLNTYAAHKKKGTRNTQRFQTFLLVFFRQCRQPVPNERARAPLLLLLLLLPDFLQPQSQAVTITHSSWLSAMPSVFFKSIITFFTHFLLAVFVLTYPRDTTPHPNSLPNACPHRRRSRSCGWRWRRGCHKLF